MDEITFLTQTLSILVLFLISSITFFISNKVKIPYTVLLVFIGLLLVPISHLPFFHFIDDFKLTPNVLFYVFLPVLLFEASYNINYKSLLKNWKSIGILAVFGLLISSTFIAIVLFLLFPFIGLEIPFLVCLLFGSIISATDPVAVLSIFKSMGAPRRLTLIFEGESLFNDGTSVALFVVVLGIIVAGGDITGLTVATGIGKFLSMLIGGMIFGVFMGGLFSKAIGYIKNNEVIEIGLTMVVAHMTFILAELITEHFEFLPISGVIATVMCGIVIGNYGKYKLTPRVEIHMHKFWDFFAFITNSIVFILMGLTLSLVEFNLPNFLLPIFLVIGVVIVARAISVYLGCSFINMTKLEEKIPLSWQHLLSWGSLRGALALMLVLLIPDNLTILGWNLDYSVKDFILIITIGSIVFTLFIKATTIPFLMKKMGIDKLHKLEEFEYEEGKILANLKILEKLTSSYKKAYLIKEEYEELQIKYQKKLTDSVKSLGKILDLEGVKAKVLIKRAITLHALGIEKQHLKELFNYNEIDEKNFKFILRKLEKQKERIENEVPQLREISNLKNDYDCFGKLGCYLFRDSKNTINRYIRNRTKLIITRKVIKELKQLSKIDFGFDKKIFNEIIELYSSFNKKADIKKTEIFLKNKAKILTVDRKLSSKSLLKLEEGVLKDLYNKDIITSKLYIKFMDEIENEIYMDLKS